MSSKDKFNRKVNTKLIETRPIENKFTNNLASYSVKKLTVEKNITTSYNTNNGKNFSKKILNKSNTSRYLKDKSNEYSIARDLAQEKNNTTYESQAINSYEYSSGTAITSNAVNLKHHPKQVNDLIHNHKFYSSKTSQSKKVLNNSRTTKTISSIRTEKSQRTQSLSPVNKNEYEIESRKVEIYNGKPRYSTASNSSGETNVSITKSQLKQLMSNMWLEEIYCSNVESLCCLVDNKNRNNSNYSVEMFEKEMENNAMIIKEYEAEIIKLKSILNIKEQEMKKLAQKLKMNENTLKIKNKKLYEFDIKTAQNNEEFDKDAHELQIISTKQEIKKNLNLDKDAISLQILAIKKGWNETNVPSPINEIYIETLKRESNISKKKYEEMRRIMKRKEEEIIRLKKEKKPELEMQEMGILSIISNKPKKNNLYQRLESIMILSQKKGRPLKFQKIEEIAITSHSIKVENEIQELDGLEIINIKKNKELILQEQCLNGLEIRREYDMLLVKPVWDSLQIQGAGLNLLAIKNEIELENQEIDEFGFSGKEKPENIMEKVNNFKIKGKIKNKIVYKINKERIKLTGLPDKEEVNWNEIIVPNKSVKLLISRDYDKIQPKIDINWDDITKPVKTTKLFVKGIKPKTNILKVVKKDKFNFEYSSPSKNIEEYDIENFNINLINSEKKIKPYFKMSKVGFKIKGKEKSSLIKNRMDSINIFGLTKKNIIIPSSTQQINLLSDEIDSNKNWNDIIKIMRTKDLIITRKNKIRNIINKKVVNIEIKTSKKKIIKPTRQDKLFIKGIEKQIITKPIKLDKLFIKGIEKQIITKPIKLDKIFIKGIEKQIIVKPIKENKISIKGIKKQKIIKQIKENKIFIKGIEKIIKKPKLILIRENKIFIKGIEKIEKKPEIILRQKKENKLFIKGIKKEEKEIPEWNDIIKLKNENSLKIIGKKIINWKMEKRPSIIYIHRSKKNIIIKQNLNSINYQGIKHIEKETRKDWINILKAQRNAKFNIKGKVRNIKLSLSKCGRFTLKREPEEEIIYNDDYNYLLQPKRENGNEANNKILVIKEREIKPILHREIKAQVVRIKEDSSETSSQSEVDVLAGIKKKMTLATEKQLSSSGFSKKVVNGEVIFTPRNTLGVNLGGAKYKKQILVKKGIQFDKTEQGRMTGIEITGSNGEVHFENMSGIGGTIKEGNYLITNGSLAGKTSGGNNSKKFTTIYQSSSDIKKNNKLLKLPSDSKKNIIKKQLIIKSRLKSENKNEILSSGNMSSTHIITSKNSKDNSRKIIFNPNLAIENINQSSSTFSLSQGKGNILSVKKEETYSYEKKDNGNLITKKQGKKVESFGNIKEE